MARPTRATKATKPVEAEEVTNKTDEEVKTSEEPKISFDDYIAKNKPHYGLVASFKYEASRTEKGLADRSEEEWKLDFEAQSKKTYK